MDTLVLSAAYEPLGMVPWKRALTLLIGERVERVENYVDRFIGTIRGNLPMPSIVRFLATHVRKRWRTKVKFSRSNVYIRDNGTCQYCSRKLSYNDQDCTFDHVVPKSRGGRTTWKNYVVCCFPCNQEKRNRTPSEAGMPLLKQPIKPRMLACAATVIPKGVQIPDSWQGYI